MKIFLFFLIQLASLSAFSASGDIKPLETFDFYAAPLFGVSSGSFAAGSVDEGTSYGAHYAGRLGFKVGPILLGGEFNMINMTRSSDKKNSATTANLIKYSMDNSSGTIRSVGINLGFYTDRIVVWANYYPSTTLETTYTTIKKDSDNSYNGTAYSVELNVRVWDRIYVGAFGSQTSFSTYSTNHSSGKVTDASLDPGLKYTYYGLTVSYLLPFSELKNISKYFPDLK